MSRTKKYHYLYKIICKTTGYYYIGIHSTNNLDDNYLGSGRRIRYSVNKYGKDNHVKEILEFHNSRDELLEREKELVNENLISDWRCMNIALGGGYGFSDDDRTKELSKKGNDKFLEKFKDDTYKEEFKNKLKESRNSDKSGYALPEYGKKLSDANKKNWSDPNSTYNSEEYRKSVGRKGHTNQTGEKNSQFGTIWVSRNGEVKKIKKELFDEYSSNGWFKGMKS